MINPTDIPLKTQIWRPVTVYQHNRHRNVYTYKVEDVVFGKGKRNSPVCRLVEHYGTSIPGALIAEHAAHKGLCVFIEGEVLPDWIYLIITRTLTSSVVATPVTGSLSDLYNVFLDPNRRAAINIREIGDPDLLPRHTENFIFKGDRVLVPKGLTGEGIRDGVEFIHKQRDGFTAEVTGIPTKKSVEVSWTSENVVFSAPVTAGILSVVRG